MKKKEMTDMYSFLTSETDPRARVLDVLSDEWPLNLKTVFARVRREDALATFPRISQAVRKLKHAGVLVENRKTYAISLDWL
jgi:Fe2+ or Zn2+ uptake regulation protein